MSRISELLTELGVRTSVASVPDLAISLTYKPMTFQKTPLLYTLFQRKVVSQPENIETTTYQYRTLLAVGTQDNQQAEITLVPLIEAIVAALDTLPQLGTLVHDHTKHVVDVRRAVIKESGKNYIGAEILTHIVDRDVRGFTGHS